MPTTINVERRAEIMYATAALDIDHSVLGVSFAVRCPFAAIDVEACFPDAEAM